MTPRRRHIPGRVQRTAPPPAHEGDCPPSISIAVGVNETGGYALFVTLADVSGDIVDIRFGPDDARRLMEGLQFALDAIAEHRGDDDP